MISDIYSLTLKTVLYVYAAAAICRDGAKMLVQDDV